MNKHQNKGRLAHHPIYKKVFIFLLGKHHTRGHRVVAGFVVMAVGVCIAKQAHHCESWYSEYSIDLVGYLLHGIGATPIVEDVV